MSEHRTHSDENCILATRGGTDLQNKNKKIPKTFFFPNFFSGW